MVRLPDGVFRSLVAKASRAPSVHNIQPARWRCDGQSLTLFRALDRALPVADPSGHDVDVSLGAAFEGMSLALSEIGVELGHPFPSDAKADGCSAVCQALLSDALEDDPLAIYIEHRRSYRGKFDNASGRDIRALRQLQQEDAIVVTDRSIIDELASSYDRAAWKFESRADYHHELWSWLRLSGHDPRWHRDGLNADCLSLSRVERIAAATLFRPRAFGVLSNVGIGQLLISEAPKIRTAAAVIVFSPHRSMSAFDVGRRFYRLWLEITSIGLHAVPMSASADDPDTNSAIAAMLSLDPSRRIMNLLRAGRARVEPALSPRLPVDELIV
jgi:hypothetical protein